MNLWNYELKNLWSRQFCVQGIFFNIWRKKVYLVCQFWAFFQTLLNINIEYFEYLSKYSRLLPVKYGIPYWDWFQSLSKTRPGDLIIPDPFRWFYKLLLIILDSRRSFVDLFRPSWTILELFWSSLENVWPYKTIVVHYWPFIDL